MKRFLCVNHMHHLRTQGKSVTLSTEKCTICRFKARPITLLDMANRLERIAENMRYAHHNPDFDPFGISFLNDFEESIDKFLRSVHPDYRKGILERLNK